MYCKNCGKDNLEGAQVCAGCGAELQAVVPPVPVGPQSAPKTSPLAIWSLVLGILGWFTCLPIIPGIILGILGLKQVKDRPREFTGSGLATAGIVVSAAGVVVFAVVMMLAAIMFPVFARARGAAQAANCMSNVKMLAASTRMYLQDYQETYPPAARWSDALKPYNKMEMMYRCPAAPDLACGYGFNGSIGGQPEGIVSSGSTVLLFESDRGWNGFGGPEAMITRPRHGSLTIGCVDGHAIKVFPGYENKLQWNP